MCFPPPTAEQNYFLIAEGSKIFRICGVYIQILPLKTFIFINTLEVFHPTFSVSKIVKEFRGPSPLGWDIASFPLQD